MRWRMQMRAWCHDKSRPLLLVLAPKCAAVKPTVRDMMSGMETRHALSALPHSLFFIFATYFLLSPNDSMLHSLLSGHCFGSVSTMIANLNFYLCTHTLADVLSSLDAPYQIFIAVPFFFIQPIIRSL